MTKGKSRIPKILEVIGFLESENAVKSNFEVCFYFEREFLNSLLGFSVMVK